MKRDVIFIWLVASLVGSMLVAGGPFGCRGGTPSPGAARNQDGLVFQGSAADVPGSYGKLVLEKNFLQTRRLRWESADTRVGGTQIDFFQPSYWQLEGNPPTTLSFTDRSPVPVIVGKVWLESPNRAEVTILIGKDRVSYTLDRVEHDGNR